jgi:K+-transporting ATPase ATPase C chain
MRRQLAPALRLLVVFTVALGLLYPLAMTGVAQALFHDKADGSLVEVDGKVVGSKLDGQSCTQPAYFHPRPSAAGALASGSVGEDGKPVAFDDLSQAVSGASNMGPTDKDLLAAIKERTAAYRKENGLGPDVEVPIDAVTASASGVDPDISLANALLQARRVAEARRLPLSEVLALVHRHTDGRWLGFLGEEGVDVLELNLALDEVRG